MFDALRHNLMHPDLAAEFVAAFNEEANRKRVEHEVSLYALRRERDENSNKLDGLIEAIAEGYRAPGLQAKLDELENRKVALEAELTKAARPLPRLHPNIGRMYRQKVAALHEVFEKQATRDEALGLARSLIERVTVLPIGPKCFEIELTGAIAAMVRLALGEGAKEQAVKSSDLTACSVKLVAGIGFEPMTFRL